MQYHRFASHERHQASIALGFLAPFSRQLRALRPALERKRETSLGRERLQTGHAVVPRFTASVRQREALPTPPLEGANSAGLT